MKNRAITAQNFNIILVDDDYDDQFLFKEALEEINAAHSLKSFYSSEEILSYLRLDSAKVPDVLFLDLNMPGENGIHCLNEIRRMTKCKNVPIAIYSTSQSEADVLATLTGGANIYIKKPGDFQELKDIIGRTLQIQWEFHHLSLNISTFVMSI